MRNSGSNKSSNQIREIDKCGLKMSPQLSQARHQLLLTNAIVTSTTTNNSNLNTDNVAQLATATIPSLTNQAAIAQWMLLHQHQHQHPHPHQQQSNSAQSHLAHQLLLQQIHNHQQHMKQHHQQQQQQQHQQQQQQHHQHQQQQQQQNHLVCTCPPEVHKALLEQQLIQIPAVAAAAAAIQGRSLPNSVSLQKQQHSNASTNANSNNNNNNSSTMVNKSLNSDSVDLANKLLCSHYNHNHSHNLHHYQTLPQNISSTHNQLLQHYSHPHHPHHPHHLLMSTTGQPPPPPPPYQPTSHMKLFMNNDLNVINSTSANTSSVATVTNTIANATVGMTTATSTNHTSASLNSNVNITNSMAVNSLPIQQQQNANLYNYLTHSRQSRPPENLVEAQAHISRLESQLLYITSWIQAQNQTNGNITTPSTGVNHSSLQSLSSLCSPYLQSTSSSSSLTTASSPPTTTNATGTPTSTNSSSPSPISNTLKHASINTNPGLIVLSTASPLCPSSSSSSSASSTSTAIAALDYNSLSSLSNNNCLPCFIVSNDSIHNINNNIEPTPSNSSLESAYYVKSTTSSENNSFSGNKLPHQPIIRSSQMYVTSTTGGTHNDGCCGSSNYSNTTCSAPWHPHDKIRLSHNQVIDMKKEIDFLKKLNQSMKMSIKDQINDTFLKIKKLLNTQHVANTQPIRNERNEVDTILSQYSVDVDYQIQRLEDLEIAIEDLRTSVLNRRCRVNVDEVEVLALHLSRISKSLATSKADFPGLELRLRRIIDAELELIREDEKFIISEPRRLDSALKLCKKLISTLFTLKRLGSVQEATDSDCIPEIRSVREPSVKDKQAVMDSIKSIRIDHTDRMKKIEQADRLRECRKTMLICHEALKFEKSLELAAKTLREINTSSSIPTTTSPTLPFSNSNSSVIATNANNSNINNNKSESDSMSSLTDSDATEPFPSNTDNVNNSQQISINSVCLPTQERVPVPSTINNIIVTTATATLPSNNSNNNNSNNNNIDFNMVSNVNNHQVQRLQQHTYNLHANSSSSDASTNDPDNNSSDNTTTTPTSRTQIKSYNVKQGTILKTGHHTSRSNRSSKVAFNRCVMVEGGGEVLQLNCPDDEYDDDFGGTMSSITSPPPPPPPRLSSQDEVVLPPELPNDHYLINSGVWQQQQ